MRQAFKCSACYDFLKVPEDPASPLRCMTRAPFALMQHCPPTRRVTPSRPHRCSGPPRHLGSAAPHLHPHHTRSRLTFRITGTHDRQPPMPNGQSISHCTGQICGRSWPTSHPLSLIFNLFCGVWCLLVVGRVAVGLAGGEDAPEVVVGSAVPIAGAGWAARTRSGRFRCTRQGGGLCV